jgi:hypothetical protein
MQLACKLKSRKSVIQGTHDNVMRVLVEEVMRESPPDRSRVWDTRVRDLCSFGVGWIRVIPTFSQTAAHSRSRIPDLHVAHYIFWNSVQMFSIFAHAFHSCVFFSFLTISGPRVLLADRPARLMFSYLTPLEGLCFLRERTGSFYFLLSLSLRYPDSATSVSYF